MFRSLRDWLKPGGDWDRQRVVEMTVAAGCIVLAVALLTAALLRTRGSGGTGTPAPQHGDVRVRAHADAAMRAGDYALFATLVRGNAQVDWTKRVPADGELALGDLSGRHVLSFTIAGCGRGGCEAFHGGSAVGVVQLQGHDRATVVVTPRCTAGAAGGASGATTSLDCSATSIADSRTRR